MIAEHLQALKRGAEKVIKSRAARLTVTAVAIGGTAIGVIDSVEFDPHYYLGGVPRLAITSRLGPGLAIEDWAIYKTSTGPCQWVGKPHPDSFSKINAVVQPIDYERLAVLPGYPYALEANLQYFKGKPCK